jgi:hypothetical protein
MLQLLLPALLPSWRFFDNIGPSPRIEFALLRDPHQIDANWHAFRPRPHSLSMITLLRRLLWNPEWNETLYLTGCAEKIFDDEDSLHAQAVIQQRIVKQLTPAQRRGARWLVFRLRVILRVGEELIDELAFVSEPYPLTPDDQGDPA